VVSYLVDNAYAPQAEGGLAWDDPALAITWPLEAEAIVSDKDRAWPRLAALEALE
jgi:dTDP-4-dehydrorhamnose 3,5-epimerase